MALTGLFVAAVIGGLGLWQYHEHEVNREAAYRVRMRKLAHEVTRATKGAASEAAQVDELSRENHALEEQKLALERETLKADRMDAQATKLAMQNQELIDKLKRSGK